MVQSPWLAMAVVPEIGISPECGPRRGSYRTCFQAGPERAGLLVATGRNGIGLSCPSGIVSAQPEPTCVQRSLRGRWSCRRAYTSVTPGGVRYSEEKTSRIPIPTATASPTLAYAFRLVCGRHEEFRSGPGNASTQQDPPGCLKVRSGVAPDNWPDEAVTKTTPCPVSRGMRHGVECDKPPSDRDFTENPETVNSPERLGGSRT